MFNNLYKFKKNAWHVRFFTWIYETNPTTEFKTMCPYFWSLVGTFLFLPLILCAKFFGKAGTKFLNKIESCRRDRITKMKDAFIQKCTKEDLTPAEAHSIYYSECWRKFCWDLSLDQEKYVWKLKDIHKQFLYEEQLKKEKEIKSKPAPISYKESKLFTALSFIISFAVGGAILYIIYRGIAELCIRYVIDLKALKLISIVALIVAVIIFTAYILIYKGFPCIYDKIACIKRPSWFKGSVIFKPFIFIFSGVALIGNMFYVTYKKSCPIITWEEEEKQ